MANEQKGIDGVVKVGDICVLNVTSFSLEETTETLDVTSMGDCSGAPAARSILPTFRSFSGSFDGYWNEYDALLGHGTKDYLNDDPTGSISIAAPVIRAGETITFEFYPAGETAGHQYYWGTAIVASVSRSSSFDGAVEFSVSFEGTGDLNYGTTV